MLQYQYKVTLEGGASYEVTADQRDVAAWEVQPFGCPVQVAHEKIYTWSRFLAWNAGRRNKLHAITWEAFADACIDVERVREDEAEDSDAEDPGQTAASAVTSAG